MQASFLLEKKASSGNGKRHMDQFCFRLMTLVSEM